MEEKLINRNHKPEPNLYSTFMVQAAAEELPGLEEELRAWDAASMQAVAHAQAALNQWQMQGSAVCAPVDFDMCPRVLQGFLARYVYVSVQYMVVMLMTSTRSLLLAQV